MLDRPAIRVPAQEAANKADPIRRDRILAALAKFDAAPTAKNYDALHDMLVTVAS